MKKTIIVKKTGTETETETEYDTNTEVTETDTEVTETETEATEIEHNQGSRIRPARGGGRTQFINVKQSGYVKPRDGSIQDNFTRDDILKKLENYMPLQTLAEKKILTRVVTFKTWIKYFNIKTRQFRIGGLIIKENYPEYITLVNPRSNVLWHVQLKDNIIYIPSDVKLKTVEQVEQFKQKKKEEEIKNKLYALYKKGELARK